MSNKLLRIISKSIVLLLFLLLFFDLWRYFYPATMPVEIGPIPPEADKAQIELDVPSSLNIQKPQAAQTELPDTVLLEVPFTSQAPLYVWDETHEDACEEASLLMLYYAKKFLKFKNAEDADAKILEIIEAEKEFGYGKSITLDELNTVAKKHFSLNNLRHKSISNTEDIKSILAEGHPVIVGAAGKILPNPNFRNGGPNYHMLVIIGYNKQGFITNDPGTRKGKNFFYKYDDLFNAIHDWNETDIMLGEKNILY